MPTARFCAYCGVKLSGDVVPPAPAETAEKTDATARPLSDNPYQPHRAVVKPILTASTAENPTVRETAAASEENVKPSEAVNSETASAAAEEPAAGYGIPPEEPLPVDPPFYSSVQPQRAPVLSKESAEPAANSESVTRVRIKSSPKRVFMFSDEEEEDIRPHGKNLRSSLYADEDDDEDYIDEYDGIREFEENHEFEDDEDDYGEYEDEDDEPTAGHIFVRVFSVLTVLLLIVGLFAFAYGTSVGRRLRASMGMSSSAEDYLLLADWQLAQHTLSDASDSYYNAFKLDTDNYELALAVGTGFENASDDARAEALYSYLITHNPQKDEPYDRLMALLNRQGRTSEYEALLGYRAAQQPDYQPPVSQVSQILRTPIGSHESGAYAGSLTLTLDAGGAEIRYTIDGTAPTAQSLLYTGAINLSRGSHTVRAVAVVNGIISAEWVGNFFIS